MLFCALVRFWTSVFSTFVSAVSWLTFAPIVPRDAAIELIAAVISVNAVAAAVVELRRKTKLKDLRGLTVEVGRLGGGDKLEACFSGGCFD
jgi:hypothetical protein